MWPGEALGIRRHPKTSSAMEMSSRRSLPAVKYGTRYGLGQCNISNAGKAAAFSSKVRLSFLHHSHPNRLPAVHEAEAHAPEAWRLRVCDVTRPVP